MRIEKEGEKEDENDFLVRRHAARGATNGENGGRVTVLKHFPSVFSVPSVAFSGQTTCRTRRQKA
jgi:hypothetical protein